MKSFRLEWYKARRRGFTLVALAMAVITVLWCAVGLRDMDAAEKAGGYAFSLYQSPLLNSIVLPVMIAVLVSRSCDMEHKGNTMKALFTMQSRASLFCGKLACVFTYLLLAIGLQSAGLLLLGKIYGYTESVPFRDFLLFFFSQWLVSAFFALLIQTLALRYVNQFIPLTVGLIGGLLGLMAMFFPPYIMRLVPSAYYGLLSTVRMSWDGVAGGVTEFYYVDFSLLDCGILLAAGTVLFAVSCARFARREV